jgi:nucleoside-diphosphate-sugar epimerase
LNNKNILVTGGLGYVGSRLCPHLLARGHAVRVLDLCLYGDHGLRALQSDPAHREWSSRFELVRGDIRHPDAVATALREVDTVIHLAAVSNDPTGDIDEVLTRQVNFDAVGLLVAGARRAGVRRFINASSSSVFGKRSEADIGEELEPEPITHYSRYKMLSEWIVRGAAAADFCTVNVRPATVCGYSPRQRFDLTVNKLTADAIRKGVITVHGGEQRRPNVGISDMINLYARLVEIDAALINGQTINFGFENLKVIDIARLIREVVADLPVQIQVTPTLDHRDYHISSAKVCKVLGYQPVSSIAAEVRELRRHLLDQGDFPDVEAPHFYNMKVMKLERDSSASRFLGQAGWAGGAR